MDIPNTVDKVVTGIKRTITAKAIISTASLGLLIPFVKLVYWVFDTAYLGGFGVSPDIYNRPVFSSGFVSIWLIAKSIGIILTGWTLLAFIFFIILTKVNIAPAKYHIKKEEKKESSDNENSGTDSKELSLADKLKDRFLDLFIRIIDSISKSIEWPSAIWGAGVLLVIFLSFSIAWASKTGQDLAEDQRNAYLESGFCLDKFNSNNIGCFKIDTVEGENYFIIANPKTHLIYLSRECKLFKKGSKICEPSIKLNILEKSLNEQYSITRDFVLKSNNLKESIEE